MGNQFVIQLKKELWLHRVFLLKVPLWFCAALMVVGSIVAVIVFANTELAVSSSGHHRMIDKVNAEWLFNSAKQEQLAELNQVEHSFSDSIYELQSIKPPKMKADLELNATFDYALILFMTIFLMAGMFRDKSDGSIFFWRSLPVSEARIIGARLLFFFTVFPVVFTFWALVILICVGLGISLFGWVIGYTLVFLGPYTIWVLETAYNALFFPLVLLWFLPVITWLMLCATLAKARGMLLALAPFALMAIVEYLFFQSIDWLKAIYDYGKDGMIFVYELRGGEWYANPSVQVPESSVSALTFLLNLLLAGCFIWLSIWLRQKRID